MDLTTMKSLLTIGEHVAVEFKRCGNGMEHDVYESVCAFLNRFGGDLFMGVLDDGTVIGIPENAASDMMKNFVSVISNPAVFSPTIYLAPEIIKDEEGHVVIHVHVPPSAEVHSYKKIIYDRVDDADVKVTSTSQIASMYIRKQNIFTEKKIFPYVTMEDLRLDLLPRIRRMAVNHAGGSHPWENMDDEDLLKSAGLYGVDRSTGEKGYNLAAVMLLGKDEVIIDVCPAYETDALVRKVNVDRYDDREIVRTNLVESYDQLMEFARKHLPDKYFLENAVNVSLRNILAREMLGNTLMHREFTSSYTAKFVIEKDRMYVENANRASREGIITPDNLEPNPKNPIIASFFRTIGRADWLGSGVRNLFKYTKYYSGRKPEFIEGDVFRTIVPLDDDYSFDYEQSKSGNYEKNRMMVTEKYTKYTEMLSDLAKDTGKVREKYGKSTGKVREKLNENQKTIIDYIEMNGKITNREAQKLLDVKESRALKILRELTNKGVLRKEGKSKGTYYVMVYEE